MKKRAFIFAIVLLLVVSLVPLSGVSAQRPAPASSASLSAAPAPAAAPTYYKTLKTKIVLTYSGLNCMKYVQKTYWGYDYATITLWIITRKGVTFMPADAIYEGSVTRQTFGGIGETYFYGWTTGLFWWVPHTMFYLFDIQQEVYADGTWWKNKVWSQIDI